MSVQTNTKFVKLDGDIVTWEITACNTGRDVCHLTELKVAHIDDGLEIHFEDRIDCRTSKSPYYNNGVYDPATNVWSIGNLEGGQCETIIYKIKVPKICDVDPRLGIRVDVCTPCAENEENNCFWLYIEIEESEPTACQPNKISIK